MFKSPKKVQPCSKRTWVRRSGEGRWVPGEVTLDVATLWVLTGGSPPFKDYSVACCAGNSSEPSTEPCSPPSAGLASHLRRTAADSGPDGDRSRWCVPLEGRLFLLSQLGRRCLWYLKGRGQGCCWTSGSAQELHQHNKELSSPASVGPSLRKSVCSGLSGQQSSQRRGHVGQHLSDENELSMQDLWGETE